MKMKYAMAALGTAFVLAACEPAGNKPVSSDNDSPAEMRSEVREPVDTPKPIVADNKDPLDLTSPPETKPPIDRDIVAPEVKKEMKESEEVARNPVVETRELFVSAMEEKLKDFDEKLVALGEKIESLNTDSYAKDTFNSLRDKHTQLGLKLDAIRMTGSEIWTGLKSEFESAMEELKQAYDNAKAKYDN